METKLIQGPGPLTGLDIIGVRSLSKDFKESGLFPDINSEAQAVVKIIAGQELGLPPVYSMQNFYIIKGRLSMAAETMALLLRSKGKGKYDYQVKEHTDDKCVIQFYQDGKGAYLSTFTMADAKRAGLVKPDSGWFKFPKAMLFSRAMSQGSRIVAPELMAGAYTTEEAESITLDAEETAGEPPKPEPQEKKPRKDHKPKASESKGESSQEKEETETPEEVSATDKPPTGQPSRDPSTVKSIADLYAVCFKDFQLQPNEVMKELGIKSNSEITKTPWDCYLEIFAVYRQKQETK